MQWLLFAVLLVQLPYFFEAKLCTSYTGIADHILVSKFTDYNFILKLAPNLTSCEHELDKRFTACTQCRLKISWNDTNFDRLLSNNLQVNDEILITNLLENIEESTIVSRSNSVRVCFRKCSHENELTVNFTVKSIENIIEFHSNDNEDGVIASLNYPLKYPLNLSPIYHIVNDLPLLNNLRIYFDDFYLTNDASFEIREEKSDASSQILYDSSVFDKIRPTPIETNASKLIIDFKPMGQNMETTEFYQNYNKISYYGIWKLRYEFVPKSSIWLDRPSQLQNFNEYSISRLNCDHIFKNQKANFFTMPNEMYNYGNIDCIYIVQMNRYVKKYFVKLEFFARNLTGFNNVSLDNRPLNLVLRNGITAGSQSILNVNLTANLTKNRESLSVYQPQYGFNLEISQSLPIPPGYRLRIKGKYQENLIIRVTSSGYVPKAADGQCNAELPYDNLHACDGAQDRCIPMYSWCQYDNMPDPCGDDSNLRQLLDTLYDERDCLTIASATMQSPPYFGLSHSGVPAAAIIIIIGVLMLIACLIMGLLTFALRVWRKGVTRRVHSAQHNSNRHSDESMNRRSQIAAESLGGIQQLALEGENQSRRFYLVPNHFSIQDAPPTYEDAMKLKNDEDSSESTIASPTNDVTSPDSNRNNVTDDALSDASSSIAIEYTAPQETTIDDDELPTDERTPRPSGSAPIRVINRLCDRYHPENSNQTDFNLNIYQMQSSISYRSSGANNPTHRESFV